MPRVLIVDDEELIRRAFQRWLRTTAAEIQFATNGEEALKLLRERSYDLIISDVDMPKMDGLQLVQQIAKELPVLISKFAFFTSSLEGPLTVAGVQIPVFAKTEFNAIRTIIAQDLTKPAV